MTAHRALPLLLALALLLGQQAGLTHALSHLDRATLAKEGVAHTTLCAKCSTFEQLSSAVPSCASFGIDQSSAAPTISAADHSVVRCTVTAFHSRAPPHLS